jgi:hypothetical protein
MQSVSGQSRRGLITIHYFLIWDYWVAFPSYLTTRRDYGGSILTRLLTGRVQHSSWSWSYFTTDGQSVCLSVGHPFGAHDQILLFFLSFCRRIILLFVLGRPLWREDGSVIRNAICQWTESRKTHNYILLSHLTLLGSLSVASYDSQGLQWKYSYPPPQGECQSQSHFTDDSQSVCLGVEPTLWTFDKILLPFQEFGSGICLPASAGRPLRREAGSVPCKSQPSHPSVCTFTTHTPVTHISTTYIYIYYSTTADHAPPPTSNWRHNGSLDTRTVVNMTAAKRGVSKVEVTLRLTVIMSVCQGIEHACGICDQILFPVGMLLSEICHLVSVGRSLWREGGSAICSVITQWSEKLRTRNHTLPSHLRLPQPGGPGSRIYIPQEQGDPVIPPGTELLYGECRSRSRSFFTTDSQSVSQYVLVSSTLVGLSTRYYFLSEFNSCLLLSPPSLYPH